MVHYNIVLLTYLFTYLQFSEYHKNPSCTLLIIAAACLCTQGFSGMSDWWSTLDSERTQSDVVPQMDTSRSACNAPEFTHSLYDHDDSLCTTLRRGT